MLLEGKAATVVATGVVTAVIAGWHWLPPVAQEVVCAAALIAALKVIGSAVVAAVRGAQEVHAAVTAKLPGRMDSVEGRLDEGSREFVRINATLETMASTDRARMQGVIEGVNAPRSPRATDPKPEDRRIWFFSE